MKKHIALVIIAFISGFLLHAFVFPDFLSNIELNPQVILSNDVSATVTPFELDPLIRQITFDGQHFSRKTVSVGRTRYLSITNKSDTPMNLVSNVKDLITPRGYLREEMVKAQFNEPGTFLVQLKTNPKEQLVITVK